MTARWRKTRTFSSGTVATALFASVALHGLLLAGFGFLKEPAREQTHEIDSRVADGPGLFLDLSPGIARKPGGGSEEEQGTFDVQVARPLPYTSGGEPGPVVQGPSARKDGTTGRGAAGSPGADGGGASFFHVPVAGRRAVFVIDRSLSMGPGGGLQAARRELARCLQSLPAGSVFQVVLYNRVAEAVEGKMLSPDAETLRRVEQRIADISAEGSTDHLKALTCALAFQPDAIFLVTDADDLTPEVLRAIAGANRCGATIHTIDVSRRRTGCAALADLARQQRGTHVRVFAPGTSVWPH